MEYKARRLTIPELERYIQRQCSCSVCEFARDEILALRMGAPSYLSTPRRRASAVRGDSNT